MILLGWLALSLNVTPLTDLLAATGPTMIRKYEGTGTMTQTATTHYGNRASATCTRATRIEAILYSDGSATLTLKYSPFFHFTLGNPNPALGLPPTLGNVICAAPFTATSDPYHGTYSLRFSSVTTPSSGVFSVSTRGENITGSFDDETLSGSLEFTGTRSLTIGLDGSTGEVTETKTLRFTIPITFLGKLLVKGTVRDFYGQPVAARLYWARDHEPITPFRYFSSDQNGHFEFDAVDSTPTRIYTGLRSWGDSPYHPFHTTVHPPMEEVTITLVPNTVGGENGVLLGVGGTVEIKYPDTGIWQEAQVGMILIQGVELRTGPNSHAWGLLAPEQADRPFFYKEENTHVRNLTAPTPGTIRLLLGTLWYKAKSILNRSNRHQVATENATASVLGTEVKFETSSEGDTITLIEGRVEVRPVALPEELTILNPGERLHIKGANIELEQLSEQELEALRDTLEDFEFIVDPQLKFDFESEQQAGVWIEDASGSWRVSEGMYVMTGARAGVEIYSYFVEELRDLTFEADLRKIEGDSPGAFTEYGMRFRSDGTSHNFYQFAISTDGLYSVGKMVAGVFTPLIGWTRSEALNLGHGAWNRLKAVAQGVELSFYANGNLLNLVEDASLSSGKAGLFARDGASSQPRDTVQFDNVALAQATGGGTGGGTGGLIHQYRFNEGRGTTVEDSVGHSDAVIRGEGYTWGSGMLTLPGGPSTSAAYVDLPNGIVSSLESATIEAWVAVDTPSFYARVLDFGSSTAGEFESPGGTGTILENLVLTASVDQDINRQRVSIWDGDIYRVHYADGSAEATLGDVFHAVLVVNSAVSEVRYYRDGELLATFSTDIKLEEISDVNNWLGRSNDTSDPNFSGSYLEFRIYDRALSEEEVRSSYVAGADAGGSSGGTVAQPPQITAQPQSVSVTQGGDAEFRVVASGTGPLSYQWRRNNQPISGAISATLQLSSVNAADTGEYTAVVSSAAGSVTSAAAVLEVGSGNGIAGLIHRYTFNEGQGRTVEDSLGNADGEVKGEGYSWAPGILTLPGGASTSAAYVDLPNGIISSLSDATFEAWVTVNGQRVWARIFDFGSTSVPGGELDGPGGEGSGADYILLSASIGWNINVQHVEIRDADSGRGNSIDSQGATTLGEEYHVAVVFDSGAGEIRYYRNGSLLSFFATDINLRDIDDVNNWLGRSNWTGDENLQGTLNEFRIYDRALSEDEVRNSYAAGTDAGGSSGGTVAQPPQITAQPQSVTVTAGEAIEFRVTASGTSPLSYQWRHNNQPITGATSATLQLSSVSASDAGEYTAVISNTAGSVTSAAAVLEVDSDTCITAPSGLVGWWTGDGTVADAAGDRPGTLMNGAGYAAGNVGEGFVFDGVDDYVEVADSDLWAFGANDFTIELWTRFNSVRPGSSIGVPAAVFLGNDAGAGASPKWFFSYGGGLLTFLNGRDFMAETQFAPILQQWYHLAIRRSGNTYSIYVDGRQISSEEDGFVIPNPPAPLTIGQAEGIGFFDGQLDEISIFHRALSDAEIRAIHQSGSNGKCRAPSGGSGAGSGAGGLIHQYTFSEGQGTTVEDLVGNADAMIKGEGYTWGSGMLILPGGVSTTAAYLDLPNGIISSLENATIEAWVTVNTPSFYARILDFGSSTAGELEGPGGDGTGFDYLVLTASVGENINAQRLAVMEGDIPRSHYIDGGGTTTLGEPFHLAVVIDKSAGEMRYFRDGEPLAVLPTDVTLAEITDVNNWLGRSNWTGEPNFAGSYLEFRIYDRALSEDEVRNSYAAGTDAGGSSGGTVAQPPQITAQPQSVTVTAGEAIEFRFTASGTSPLSYQWRRNGQPINGATSASLQLPSVSAQDAGEYTVVVGNTAGQVESQPAILTVELQPSDGPFALRHLPSNYFGGSPMSVRIEVNPPEQASAYVLEEQPPPGWTVDTIDSGGIYDTLNRKIKWIFLDNQARSLSYQVTPPQNAQGMVTFSGLVSFAGAEDKAIAGDLSLTTAPTTDPPQISIAIDAGGNMVLTFEGALQSAADVTGPYAEMPGAVSPLIVAPSATSHFYRSVRP